MNNNKTPILKSGERPLSASNKQKLISEEKNSDPNGKRKGGLFQSFNRNDMVIESDLQIGANAPEHEIS